MEVDQRAETRLQ